MTDEVNEAVCPECKGRQWYVGDKARPCVCLTREMLASYLGPDINGATQIRESPLYALDANFNKVTLDRLAENLFIKASWPALLPHLRLALGHRRYLDATFRFSILTDERVINVYVGNESFKARAGRPSHENVNGLKDLVEAPNLVIVRLGFLGWKNVAAPGALKQALMIREAALKPTWVVQNPAGEYPVSWNEEVAAYLLEYFDVVDLRKIATTVVEISRPMMEVEEHETKPTPTPSADPPTPAELMPTIDDDPLGVTRAGNHKAGYKRYGYGKKKRHDDGNEGGGGDLPPI